MEIVMKTMRNKLQQITSSPNFMSALLMLLLFSCLLMLPHTAAASAITCSAGVLGCHFTPTVKDGTARNVPDGRFTGSHARHSGYSTGSKRQYLLACTRCHPSSAYTNSHQSGFKNITGSSLPGNRYSQGKKIANTNNPAFGNCSNIYCHSNGRGTGMGQLQYSSSKWGGTETCLGCHGGRTTGGAYARSVGNFTLSTTHSQHLKYPAANINCQICHSKTATDATTLKNFTGVQHHVNGVRDVTFTNIAYASYTSYKSTESGSSGTSRICTNTSCHGGKTRSAWSATTTNDTHTCTHCHGQPQTAAIATSNTNKKMYAPGWINGAYTGTSTDQISVNTDIRVGAHFVHLSSTYMPKIKCNECHYVPTDPFDVSNNHMNGPRYSSQSIYFGQASTARILIGVASGSTPSQLSAFSGFTSGTATKAATCSSVYCHGNRMKNNITSGTARKPSWNQDLTATPATTTSCARCHGYPPTDGGLHGAGDTTCSSCHSHVATGVNPTSFVNKALHINGRVEGGGDCIGCHGASAKGARRAVNADFTGKSHHVTSGTLTKWHCIICHAEGDTSSGGTTSVHANGSVDLRNVDSPGNPGTAGTNYWSIPVTKAAADYTNIDNFCFGCHDSVGSASVAYNGTAVITTGLTATQQQKPFNDNLTNSYDAIARSRVVDVSTQFTTTNFSHHAVKAAKYTAVGGLPFNTTTILQGGNVDDNSRLHCHDCHYLNGHGTANNEYMLQNSTGADTLHTASTYVCLKCHTATYSTNGHTAGNGSDFVNGRSGNYNVTGISCTACHNTGGMMWGGIHGGNYTYTVGTTPGWTTTGGTGSGQSTYRFMPGMANNGYSPANWTAATAAITCYTNPNASWSACTSHTGGKTATVTRAGGARALSY